MVLCREVFKTLPRINWFNALDVFSGNNQFATMGGNSKIWKDFHWLLHAEYRGKFHDNQNFKGVKIMLTLQPEIQPVQLSARTVQFVDRNRYGWNTRATTEGTQKNVGKKSESASITFIVITAKKRNAKKWPWFTDFEQHFRT